MENENSEIGGEAKQSPLIIPGAILLAGVIIAGAVMYSGDSKTTVEAPNLGKQTAAVSASDEAKTLLQASPGDFVLGNPQAKVTLVEFADFQCPFCEKYFHETFPQIKEKYAKTGKVKFIFRNFAFLGEESFRAAEAARCAGDQGRFWDYHDYLYDHQRGENQGAFSDVNLKKFADTLKVDRAMFDACFDAGNYRELVKKESELGRELDVSGTPTTFVNGKAITGAVPFSTLEKEIQAALIAGGN